MTNHRDAFGTPISIGDRASYVYNAYSTLTFCKVRVIGVTPKMVKIVIDEYYDNGKQHQDEKLYKGTIVNPTGVEKTIMPHYLIVEPTPVRN